MAIAAAVWVFPVPGGPETTVTRDVLAASTTDRCDPLNAMVLNSDGDGGLSSQALGL